MKRYLLGALGAGFLTLAAFAGIWRFSRAAPAPASKGDLRLTIVEDGSGSMTPARVEVVGAGGAAYVADDALVVGGDCMPRAIPWRDAQEEARATLSGAIMNPFTGKQNFYSAGMSRLSLPPGRYQVRASKGIEFRPSVQTITVEDGRPTEVTMKLARWINLTKTGWWSADAHLHVSRPTPDRNAIIAQWMQAEDLSIANLLQMGTQKHFFGNRQYAFGADGIYRTGNYLLAAGQENPRTHVLGHGIILGGSGPINFADRYLLYRRFWEEARRQGALAGYAHGGLHGGAQNGLAVDLPDRLVTFIEVLQKGEARWDVWYNIQNTGFRLTPVAGTDFPCMQTLPGRERFYTQLSGPVTYDAWLEGIRRGNVFVTNGPLLIAFRVGGQRIGAELRLKHPARVPVEVHVRFDPNQDDVEKAELIENGTVVRTLVRASSASEIKEEFSYRIGESAWLALRVSGKKRNEVAAAPSLAHSGAVYVTMENAPTLAQHPRAKALARTWLTRLGELESRLKAQGEWIGRSTRNDEVTGEEVEKNRADLTASIRAAKEYFEAQGR